MPPEVEPPILFNISGPYGVGKDTMLNHILREHGERLHRVGTVTTRPATADADPSYRSVDQEAFDRITGRGRWIVNRQLGGKIAYGTSLDEIEERAAGGTISIHSIFPGPAGAGRLREQFGARLVSVALLPARGDLAQQLSELERRMIARGREGADTIREKLAAQTDQIAFILDNPAVPTPHGALPVFDRIVINERLDVAVAEVVSYFRSRFATL